MAHVKDFIRRRLPFLTLAAYRLRHSDRIKRLKGRTPEDVFTEYYQSAHWQGNESASGGGSDLKRTEQIRAALPQVIAEHHIHSLLDVPCGDFNWMQHVGFPEDMCYIGGDIVGQLMAETQVKFGGPNRKFIKLNLIEDPLPEADLLLCRDCMVHLSFSDLERAVNNIRQATIRYVMATTFVEWPHNRDILTGQWRPLNLQRPPFSWPEPIVLIREPTDEGDGGFKDKALGLWRASDVAFSR